MNTFDELLNSLTVDRLKKRLSLLDTRERPKRKAEIIDLIRRHMLSQRCKGYWEGLEALEKKAVAEAVYRYSGHFESARFAARYGSVPDYFTQSPLDFFDSVRSKAHSVLFLFFYSGVIPKELCKHLQTFVAVPEPDSLTTVDESDIPAKLEIDEPRIVEAEGKDYPYPVKILTMEPVVVHDLRAVLYLIESGQVGVSDKTGLATATGLRKIEATLMGGDFYTQEEDWELEKWAGGLLRPIRPFAWPLLVQSGGVAKRNGRRLALTRKGKKALTVPIEDTVRELYSRWRDKGMRDEFRRVDVIKGQTGKGRRLTAAAGRRAVIEGALRECPVNEWVDIDAFFRYMQAEGHDFEVVHDPWKLYIADQHYGSLGYSGYHDFHTVQARYILTYLFEYLATLGMIDIAYALPYHVRRDYSDMWGTDDLSFLSRYDGLLYFRLNPLGAFCLGLVDEYLPSRPKVVPLLQVGEGLDISLTRQAEPGERLLLDEYAQPLLDDTWQLTQDAILQAMENGHDLGVFRQFLMDFAQQALPQEVDRFFEAADQRRSAIADGGPARLLNCASDGLARMIATDPATKKYCLRAGGRTLVVPEKMEKPFRKELRKLGYVFLNG